MGRKSRTKRDRGKMPPSAQEVKKKGWWWLAIMATATVSVATVSYYLYQHDSSEQMSAPRSVTATVKPAFFASPPGFHTSAVSDSPYEPDKYFHRDFKRWLYEYFDQHPSRELMRRLKGYFENGKAELGFESRVFFELQGKGDVLSPTARIHQGSNPSLPKMIFDTIIFDRRYTSVQIAFRTIEHEGGHLDRAMRDSSLLQLYTSPPGIQVSRDEIRLLYEDEVKSFRAVCILAEGKPDYLDTSSDDPDYCLEYWRNGDQSIRDMVARMYTSAYDVYKQHRDYIFQLAKDPNAR